MGMALAACDGSQAVVSSEPAAPRAGIDAVSYAFAQAMQEDEVRAAVRDAMRGSLVSEHKLVLQEFVGTQRGRLLVERAARAAGTTPEALLAQIAGMPEMDFYVASREQRLSWNGGDRVAVVGTVADDAAALTGFDVRGRAVEQRGAGTVAGTEAVFVLHPAEVKHFRVHPQADVRGGVIQEAYDGEWAGAVTERNAAGNLVTTQYADMVPGGRFPMPAAGLPAEGSLLARRGPSFVTTTGPGIFLTYLTASFSDGVYGACEMIFRTNVRTSQNLPVGSEATHTASSVECPKEHPWETRFPPRGRRSSTVVPGGCNIISVAMSEDDSAIDDNYGIAEWSTPSGFCPDDFGIPKTYIPGTTLSVKWYAS